MAKDPAFLFYPNDWLGGTLGMSFFEKGAYMEILMMQFNRGHMTYDMIAHVLGQSGGQNVVELWSKLKHKFIQDDDGLWYNERLEVEQIKRAKYVESRGNNKKGNNQHTKKKKKSRSYDQSYDDDKTIHLSSHMENRDINENESVIKEEEKEKGVEKEKEGDVEIKRVTMPFNGLFSKMWSEWKDYRWEQHQFKYKSAGSEQAALHEIVGLAYGKEEVAIAIIKQSMAKGWKGFFELKKQDNAGAKKSTAGFSREGIQQEFNRRYQSGK